MDLSWTVDRAGDASLVRCLVRNDGAVPRRVRVESRFEAPVLPPRRSGVPADGWDANGATLRVAPGERRGLGFAAPAEPVDPPVAIADAEPIDPESSAPDRAGSVDGDGDAGPTAADALRDLADHRPPRAAVDGDGGIGGAGGIGSGGGIAVSAGVDEDSEGDEERTTEDRRGDAAVVGETGVSTAASRDGERVPSEDERPSSDPVDDWLDAVERRVDRAERLTDADVATATAAVADAGGLDAVAELDEGVEDDAARLRAVSERAASLAERAAAADVPVEALERLA